MRNSSNPTFGKRSSKDEESKPSYSALVNQKDTSKLAVYSQRNNTAASTAQEKP